MPDLGVMRLVALTGYGTESDRQNTRDAGFDVHLTKPVDPQALDAVLGRSS
jgi:CheY-like chemotaxis protein